MKNKKRYIIGDIIGVTLGFMIFVVPFLFMICIALKDKVSANTLSFSLPTTWEFSNFTYVIQADNYQLLTALKNSAILMIGSLIFLVVLSSMTGYVLQRRKDKWTTVISALILMGLMMPPSILPTITVLQTLGLYKTMFGMILVEVALYTPYTVMLYRGFVASVPRDLEEAAIIDGCGRFGVYRRIIFPLLKPITASIIITTGVTIYNDFANPLYFFPGKDNMTIQTTLYSYIGKYSSSYNLMFANVLVITIPTFILFLIFNKKIVAGMVSGAVKG